jgi:fucose permease
MQAIAERQETIDTRLFVRDGLTWGGYLLYGYWSYIWAAFGAFVPYLITEFKIDYSTAALHFSALALGPFISGFFGDKIIRGLGLAKTISSGVSIMLVGLLLTVVGQDLFCTISGALLIGFGGNIMSQSITTSMSNRFGNQRAIGISEIQVVGSIFTLLAPLAVSTVAKLGFDWRYALSGSFGLFAMVVIANRNLFRGFADSTSRKTVSHAASKLSPTYWLFFTVIFFSVASEWSVAFWSPEFLGKTFNLSKPDAAFGMSIFVTAMLLGRIIGPRLLRFVSETRLLACSATIAAIGFLVFWLARDLPINLIGLFIMGVGESNVYPLCFSQAIAATSGSSEKAAARMSLSTGSAILFAPLFLGMLADKVGIGNSYGMIACSLVLAAGVAICRSLSTISNLRVSGSSEASR